MTTRVRRKTAADPPALPGLLENTLPHGFSYKANLISEADEAAFVGIFKTLPFKPFEFQGYLGNRRIVSYGHRYDYSKRSLQQADPLPEWLTPLKTAAAGFLSVPLHTLQQALITEYAPGAGIGWHRDKPMFEHVVAISFLAPCVLRFRRGTQGNWLRQKQLVAPRSGYVLSGDARDIWEHSIAPMDLLRYSVTFRDFRPT